VFASLIPASLNNLSGMGFVFLNGSIGQHSNIVVNVKIEQRTGLSTSFVDDEIVESVMLKVRARQQDLTLLDR
jgi:hypothetical protein